MRLFSCRSLSKWIPLLTQSVWPPWDVGSILQDCLSTIPICGVTAGISAEINTKKNDNR